MMTDPSAGQPAHAAASGQPEPTERAGARWAGATALGLGLAFPIGYLCSFLGLLIFYLGLFFFLLLGLLLGAAMYRVGQAARPVRRDVIIGSVSLVSAVVMLVSLYFEYRNLCPHVAARVLGMTPALPEDKTPQDVRQQVRRFVERSLREDHPPGGLIGYVLWASGDGELTCPAVRATGRPIAYKLSQSPLGWKLRVILSAVLLAGAVLSQVWPLRRSAAPREPTAESVEQDQLKLDEPSTAGS